MNLKPLISVIVPIYNVDRYLGRCLNSIISQTYKNIEIILVNDGSTDNSFSICQNYQKMYPNISIINQSNQGLSVARNVGIEKATGEYIMFIDSDDWIHSNTINILYKDLIGYKAEIAICGMTKCFSYSPNTVLRKSRVESLDQKEAIKRMLNGEWISAWAKLYKKELFNNIKFPPGKTNEDYPVLIHLFEQCKCITYNSIPLYYYYYREGSICNSPLSLRKFDEIDNAQHVAEYTYHSFPDLYYLAEFNWIASLIKLYFTIISYDINSYKPQQIRIRQTIKKNFKSFFFNRKVGIKYKPFILSILLGSQFSRIWGEIYNIYCKIKNVTQNILQ